MFKQLKYKKLLDYIENSIKGVFTWVIRSILDFDKHSWPVAVELILHKEKPLGKAGTWLKQAVITLDQQA